MNKQVFRVTAVVTLDVETDSAEAAFEYTRTVLEQDGFNVEDMYDDVVEVKA